MTGEFEPQPRIEERILTALGYGYCLDIPLGEGGQVLGRNFLDAYNDPVKRQSTEHFLNGFLNMSETDPDYAVTKELVGYSMEYWFGKLQSE